MCNFFPHLLCTNSSCQFCKYKERFIACWYLILQKAKTSFLPPIYNVIKYIDKLGQCYGPYSYFNKGQGTNFSYLPMGYWLESMDWVHFYIYLTVVTILGGKYHFQCSIICFFNKWYINFVFASYIFFFLLECNSQYLYKLFPVWKTLLIAFISRNGCMFCFCFDVFSSWLFGLFTFCCAKNAGPIR